MLNGTSAPSEEEWDTAARKFRSLRESLVAAYVQDSLAVEVYEASADICLAAGLLQEYIKAAHGLVQELYPAVRRSAAASEPAVAAGTRTGPADARARNIEAPSCSGREAEFVAAQALLFACAAPQPGLARGVALLRSTEWQLHRSSAPVRFALQAMAAVSRGDWAAYVRLVHEAPLPSLRRLMEVRLPKVWTVGVAAMCSAYRSLPASAAAAMLGLGGDSAEPPTDGGEAAAVKAGRSPSNGNAATLAALQHALATAAASGLKAAQVALDGVCAWEQPHAGAALGAELTFRA